MHPDEPDARTLLVIDRLEAVATRIELLATEMEARLQLGGSGQGEG